MNKIKDILANLKNVTWDTWTRLALALVTIYIVVAPMFGQVVTFTVEDFSELFGRLGSSISVIWFFWKNNNFTTKALAAQKVIDGTATVCLK